MCFGKYLIQQNIPAGPGSGGKYLYVQSYAYIPLGLQTRTMSDQGETMFKVYLKLADKHSDVDERECCEKHAGLYEY